MDDHTDEDSCIRIFESFSAPSGPDLADMSHWRRGLGWFRVSQFTVRSEVHAPLFRVTLAAVIGTTGLCGAARSTASSDGKEPSV